MKIGEFLKQQRELKGHSQTEVSKLTGMSISNVSKIETGRLNGTLEMVNKLLDCYGLETVESTIEKHNTLTTYLKEICGRDSENGLARMILNKLDGL